MSRLSITVVAVVMVAGTGNRPQNGYCISAGHIKRRVEWRVAPKSSEEVVSMHFVLLASHGAEICPTANAKTRDLLLKRAPEIPALAKRLGVNLIAGPFVSREHISVVVVEAAKAEAVDQFISESGLAQWNSVRVLPSLTMEEGMKELSAMKTIF